MAECMPESYGHTYLTSYGWAGSGTGLRQGAIDKPLAIPPKKNLSGLGNDRDDAFPFWDHLFTAASKAIKIRVSSDDEDVDDPEDPSSHTDPLLRTTTGIISNRRPIHGTPASTSGSTTPNPNTDIDAKGRPSLLATAKREAAKRNLYSRFFRGPVLCPDDNPHLAPSSEFSSISTPVLEHLGYQDDIVEEPKKSKSKKRKSTDKAETREERRERKRLKKERKAVRAAKKAERALAREMAGGKRDWLDDVDRKARKQRDKETRSKENETSPYPKKGRKQARKSVAGSDGDDPEPAKCMEEELSPSNNGQQGTLHRPPSSAGATDIFKVVLTTKKKRKRKNTPP